MRIEWIHSSYDGQADDTQNLCRMDICHSGNEYPNTLGYKRTYGGCSAGRYHPGKPIRRCPAAHIGIGSTGFFFGDGGVIGGFVGFYSYNALKNSIGMMSASFAAAWLSIFIAALVCAVEMYIAGTFPLLAGLIFMGLYHAVIGVVGEGLITAIVVRAILQTRPDIISEKSLVKVAA